VDSMSEAYDRWIVPTVFLPFALELARRIAERSPVTGMVPYGNGYLMVAEDGGVFTFSDLPFAGSLGARSPIRPVVSVASAAR
jgi:hypothetical protein